MAKPPAITRRQRRLPRQAPGVRLPLRRDLRRHPVGLGLRPARRGAQGEHQAPVVAVHGAVPATTWSASTPRDPAAPDLGGQRPRRDLHRPADRVPVVPQAVPRRPPPGGVRREEGRRWRVDPDAVDLATLACPNCGTRGAWTEPRQFSGLLKTYLGVVEDESGLHYLRPETAQGIFLNFANVVTSAAQEAAVRHRPDRQELPQRDHAGQLHLPHPRVRADGDGVLRQARRGRGVAPVLDRRAHPLVHRPRHRPGQPAALRAPQGEAQPLLQAHRRHRVPLRVRRLGVG